MDRNFAASISLSVSGVFGSMQITMSDCDRMDVSTSAPVEQEMPSISFRLRDQASTR